ncbi:sulfatase-like hydrolase/transferase [Ekhidna lutea]|nr:sulfatase-like hydrolase/transferase [Ekhidna lutea]
MKKGVFAISFLLGVSSIIAQERPNIILFYIDDLNFNHLSYFGGDVYTPTIDSLFENGIVFEKGYVTSAVCTPSRYTLLTGKYASKSNNLRSKTLEGEIPNVGFTTQLQMDQTWVSELSNSGYHTGMVGKWHLGFKDPYIIDKDANPSDSAVLSQLAFNYSELQNSIMSYGFDEVGAAYKANLGALNPKNLRNHNVEWISKEGIEFIDRNKDSPFFLYYSSTVPHGPDPYKSLIRDRFITALGISNSIPSFVPMMLSRDSILSLVSSLNREQPYMTWLDEGIRVIIDKLRQINKLENTAIIFLSDHGIRGKNHNYESARVPFMISHPSLNNSHLTKNRIAANLDIGPTILELADIPYDKDNFDGESLFKLTNPNSEWRNDLLLEIGFSRALVTDDGYKYLTVRYTDELNDLEKSGTKFTHYGREYIGSNTPLLFEADSLFPAYFDKDQVYDLNADSLEQNNIFNRIESTILRSNLTHRLNYHLLEHSQIEGEYSKYGNNGEKSLISINDETSKLELFRAFSGYFEISDNIQFADNSYLPDTLYINLSIPNNGAIEINEVNTPEWAGYRVKGLKEGKKQTTLFFELIKHSTPRDTGNLMINVKVNNQVYQYNLAFDFTPLSTGENPEIFLFPTNSTNYIKIMGLTQRDHLFEVIDLSGKVLIEGGVTNMSNEISIESLKHGVYILKVDNEVIGKVIKN